MQITDFQFDLPNEAIAKFPTPERTASRLLHLDRQDGEITHRTFTDIIDYLNPGDVLVLNNTKVINARLYGQKETGGKIELLIERLLNDHECLAHIRASKSPKPGTRIYILVDKPVEVEILERQGDLFHCRFITDKTILTLLPDIGHVPLPPYMERDDTDFDCERYQTVFAEHDGAVAAPTAGLHFDDAFLDRIRAKGILIEKVTLHVGAGTFQPVRVQDITQHHMHSEWIDVSQATVDRILQAKQEGHRVIAVGTTVVRCLETAALSGHLAAYCGETDIFIYPGFKFKVVDALITNFHLPGSSLIMLVSAFAQRESILKAYQTAIESGYRFYSYGDAMLIDNKLGVSNEI